MLKTNIKAGPITNLTDARYFAAREVTWLSFDFNETSETFLPPRMMSAIREWVDGVQFIGEFNMMMTTPSEIKDIVESLQLDAIQVDAFTEVALLVDLQVPVIKEIIIEPKTTSAQVRAQLELFQPWAQFFLLNFEKNGITWKMLQESKTLPLSELRDWCARFSIIFAIDFQKEMLNNFLNMLHPYGLCVKGGEEEKIGYKSFDELDEIFDLLELSEQF